MKRSTQAAWPSFSKLREKIFWSKMAGMAGRFLRRAYHQKGRGVGRLRNPGHHHRPRSGRFCSGQHKNPIGDLEKGFKDRRFHGRASRKSFRELFTISLIFKGSEAGNQVLFRSFTQSGQNRRKPAGLIFLTDFCGSKYNLKEGYLQGISTKTKVKRFRLQIPKTPFRFLRLKSRKREDYEPEGESGGVSPPP